MNLQNTIVFILVAGAVVFLAFKFLRPIIIGKKKDNPEKNGAGCENDCNCK